jgi:hypothetical protein
MCDISDLEVLDKGCSVSFFGVVKVLKDIELKRGI